MDPDAPIEGGLEPRGEGYEPVATGAPPLPDEPRDALAIVVHLTDLHLDPRARDGQPRSLDDEPDQVPPSVQDRGGVESLLDGGVAELLRWWGRRRGSFANATAWSQLPSTVDGQLSILEEASPGAAVLLAQTGDVEAAGRAPDGTFYGYQELDRFMLEPLAGRATVVEVYGNHDIWPPRIPDPGFRTAHADGAKLLAASRPSLAGPWTATTVSPPAAPATTVHVHRIDTIEPRTPSGAVFARGRVHRERDAAGAKVADHPVDRIVDAIGAAPGDVHLILSHHPLLPVDLSIGTVVQAHVRKATEVRWELSDRALFLSGHLHRVLPAPHTSDPETPTQLVADSPTVAGSLDERTGRHRQTPSLAIVAIRARTPEGGEDLSLPERFEIRRRTVAYTRADGYRPSLWERDVVPRNVAEGASPS
ncbi:MAG TPA: hypothetical protein VF228_25905 [Iamia sp.]